MSHRTNLHHVDDMIEYGERAVTYLGGRSLPDLLADTMRSDAVARAVEIMGEACKRLPDAVKNRFPSVPWRNIARTRDKLIHHYDGVNWTIVWDIVSAHIPATIVELRAIRDILRAEEPPQPEVPPDA
jgi:uncharacterized protein with HEPN domain